MFPGKRSGHLEKFEMYIAIAGNIGCGKTSLTKILSERTGAKAYFEESDNPYIGDFYDDMNRWSFNLQIYFLGQRIRQAKRSWLPAAT